MQLVDVVRHRTVGLPVERRRRAGGDAGRLQAVEAPLHDEGGFHASRLLRVLHLVERDERVRLRAERRRVLEAQLVLQLGLFAVALVPLLAGHLARSAADAVGDVDQRRPDRARGRGWRHVRPLGDPDLRAAGRPALTTLTRHALVSWVPAPGSVASIVRWLTLGPVDSPSKPQLYGIQTTVTSRSPIFSAFMRGVTRALTSSSPRADETRTQSPDFTSSFCGEGDAAAPAPVRGRAR